MFRKRQRKPRRKKIITGVGSVIIGGGVLSAALLYNKRQKAEQRDLGVPPSRAHRQEKSDPNVLTQASANRTPLLSVGLTAAERRARGLGKLSQKQRSNLGNKYGYNLETQRFGKNVSKSSRRKAAKILRSVGRFKRSHRLTAFG